MIRISINTFPNIRAESTQLKEDAASGSNAIVVENPIGFAEGDYIVIGDVGQDNAEQQQIDTISGNIFTLIDTLVIGHAKKEPVTCLLYNRLKLYKSSETTDTQPDQSTFTVLEEKEVNVTDNYTYFVDFDGSSINWYRYRYVNYENGRETELYEYLRGSQFALLDTIRVLLNDYPDSAGNTKYPESLLRANIDAAVKQMVARGITGFTSINGYVTPSLSNTQEVIVALLVAENLEPSYIDYSFTDGDKRWSQSLNALGDSGRANLLDKLIDEESSASDSLVQGSDIHKIVENTLLSRDLYVAQVNASRI